MSINNKFREIQTTIIFDNIYKICLNRPTKYNAFNKEMYLEFVAALKEADQNESILLAVVTGAGEYFSSGNDLRNFTANIDPSKTEEVLKQGCDLVENLVNTVIQFSKPLVALVNGPSIGIAFTILGLFDLIIASDKATFHAPFTQLALSPEGCSSYTFPKILGPIRAADVLLFNKKLSAQEAYSFGLVNEIIPSENFEIKAMEKIRIFSEIPADSLIESKRFIRNSNKEKLLEVNKKEMQVLYKRFLTGDFLQAVMTFMSKKSKL